MSLVFPTEVDGEPGASSPSVGPDSEVGVAVVLPPRPNPGPLPWPEPALTPGLFLMGIVGFLTSLAMIVWGWRRLRSRILVRTPYAPQTHAPREPATPAEQLLGAAARVREAIAVRLGPAGASRTTEELCCDPRLVAWLGDDQAQRVFRLLALSDRLKFAMNRDEADLDPAQGEEAEVLASEVESMDARSAAGTSSRMEGR